MPAAFSWFLALRYLLTRWVNVLGVGGVAVAVWALIVVISVFSGFIAGIREHTKTSSPDLLATDLPKDQSYATLRETIETDPDVLTTAPRLRHFGIFYEVGVRGQRLQRSQNLDANSLESNYVALIGIDPELELAATRLRTWLTDGASMGADPDAPLTVPLDVEERGRMRNGLEVDPAGLRRSLAPGLMLGRAGRSPFGPRRGDHLDVVSATFGDDADGETEVQTTMKRFCLAGSFETGHRLFDDNTALVPIETLRTLLGHDAEDDFSVDIVTGVAIAVREGADLPRVARRIEDNLRTLLAENGGGDCRVLTWEEQNSVFLGAVDQERALMKLVLFAVMLVAAFLIYSTLHMMVTQKIKDVGILAAMGATPRGIRAIFILCGLVVGVVGCTLGAVSGALSAIYLNPVNDWVLANFGVELFPKDLYSLNQVPYRLEAGWIAQVVIGAFILSLLVAWLPARRAAALHPVEALSYE